MYYALATTIDIPVLHCFANTVYYIPSSTIQLEPDEHWTVEHVLQWHLIKSHQVTDVKHEELVASLRTQLEVGKTELLQLHNEQQQQENLSNNNSNNNTGATGKSLASNNNNTAAAAAASRTKTTTTTIRTTGKLTTIQIIILGGPHANPQTVYSLQPKSNAPCMVGRSAGKKFRDKGISLTKDSEVSTTHGKFEIKAAGTTAYFTDVGSTNGTTFQNNLLEPNEPFLLEENMVLVLGGTTIRITGLLRA
jgi:hypothetical protein